MDCGITAGFGGLIGAETLASLKGFGWTRVRNGHYTGSPALIASLVEEIVAAGLAPVITCTAAQLETMPMGIDVEVRDAPDQNPAGGEPSFTQDPAQYAASLNAAAAAARSRQLRAWACMTGLDETAIGWTAQVLRTLDPVYGISVHRYPPSGAEHWDASHWGGRQAELARLRATIGGRPWCVCEFGWHQGPYRRWFDWFTHRHLSDVQQAQNVAQEFRYWEASGARFACLYQLNDAPDVCARHPWYPNDWRGAFGIRRAAGTWKAVASTPSRLQVGAGTAAGK